jgi:uncharacterized membrane protein
MRKIAIALFFSLFTLTAFAQETTAVDNTATTEQVQSERKQSMKFMAIGALVVSAYFLFLFVTKQKANFWVVEFMAVVALLFAFMFIYLLLQPYLYQHQLSSSWLMIFIVLGVAFVTVPIHHYLMDWALEKLAHPEKKK